MINYRKLSKAVRILRQFDRRNVRYVFDILIRAEAPMSVTEITIEFYREYGFELSQSEVSQCLGILRRIKAAESEKDGKYRMYNIIPGFTDRINKALDDFKVESYETA